MKIAGKVVRRKERVVQNRHVFFAQPKIPLLAGKIHYDDVNIGNPKRVVVSSSAARLEASLRKEHFHKTDNG